MHAILHEVANIVTWPMNTGKHGAYNFFSGLGFDWMVGVALYVRHHNCHQRRCWRIGHRHPEHGWPSCKHHYNEVPDHVER